MMFELRFANFGTIEESKEPLLTVRRGTQWDGTKGERVLVTNRVLRLLRSGKQEERQVPIGYARILETKIMRFLDLQDSDLWLDHDPVCRTVNGLHCTLSNYYDNYPFVLFDRREIVTLVYFEMLETADD